MAVVSTMRVLPLQTCFVNVTGVGLFVATEVFFEVK